MLTESITHQGGAVPLGATGGLISCAQQLFVEYDLNGFHMWSLLHSAFHKQEKHGYRLLQGLMVAQTSQLSRQRRFVVQLGRASGRSSMAERELPKLPLANPNALNWRHLSKARFLLI